MVLILLHTSHWLIHLICGFGGLPRTHLWSSFPPILIPENHKSTNVPCHISHINGYGIMSMFRPNSPKMKIFNYFPQCSLMYSMHIIAENLSYIYIKGNFLATQPLFSSTPPRMQCMRWGIKPCVLLSGAWPDPVFHSYLHFFPFRVNHIQPPKGWLEAHSRMLSSNAPQHV